MSSIAIFWITLYVSWITIEFIVAEGIIMLKEQTKVIVMCSLGLLLFIGFNCGGEKNNVKELSFAEQMNIKYAHVAAHNDSVARLWREMEDTAVDLDSVLNSPHVYIPDSSKLLAIKYPNDQFTDFEQAFKKARFDLGHDKYFIWKDKLYSTNYKEEGYPPRVFQSK